MAKRTTTKAGAKQVAGAHGVAKKQQVETPVESITQVQVQDVTTRLVHDAKEAIVGYLHGDELQDSARKVLTQSLYMQHKLDTVYPTTTKGYISLVEGYMIDGKAERGAKTDFYASLLANGCDYREEKISGNINRLIKVVTECAANLVLFGPKFGIDAINAEGKLINVEFTEAGSILLPKTVEYSNWGFSQAEAIAKAIKNIDNPKEVKTSQAVGGQPSQAVSEEAGEVINPVDKFLNLVASVRTLAEDTEVISLLSPQQIIDALASLQLAVGYLELTQSVTQANAVAAKSAVA